MLGTNGGARGIAGRAPELADTATSRLRLTGAFELFLHGERRTVPVSAQRVLAYVALAGRSISRSQCAGQLWERDTEEQAARNLRTALWRLARVCGTLVLREADQLRVDPQLRIDAADLADYCQALIYQAPAIDHQLAEPILADATLLPTWTDGWLIAQRERLTLLRLQALEQAAAELAIAHPAAALMAATAAVAAEPLRETGWRLVMRIHFAQGNVAAGQRAYEKYRSLLWEELRVEPSELMAALVAARPRAERGVTLG